MFRRLFVISFVIATMLINSAIGETVLPVETVDISQLFSIDKLIQDYNENITQCEHEPGYPLIHIVPDADEIPVSEALQLAEAALYEQAGKPNSRYTSDDVRQSFVTNIMYLDYGEENDPRYVIEYSMDISALTSMWGIEKQAFTHCFDVMLFQHGTIVTVNFDDPYSMRNICTIARSLHIDADGHFLLSALWPLEDKETLYQQLCSVADREMQREKAYPSGFISDQWLAHTHSSPTVDEMQPEEAIRIAENTLLSKGLEVNQLQCGVWFYRDDAQMPEYDIWVYDEQLVMVDRITVPAYIQ